MKRIVYVADDGRVAFLIPADCGLSLEEIAAKDVPAGTPYRIVDISDIPTDRTFRDAWNVDFTIDLQKAKDIAHERRRLARSAEFAPLDIQAAIPSMAAQAEAARQLIRDKYAAIQIAIDASTTTDDLLNVLLHQLPR